VRPGEILPWEVGFLLILIAGVWLTAAETLDPEKWRKVRTIVAGLLLAIAGLLLIIAAHWGRFG
jgi:predicted metal-binding membrane protein